MTGFDPSQQNPQDALKRLAQMLRDIGFGPGAALQRLLVAPTEGAGGKRGRGGISGSGGGSGPFGGGSGGGPYMGSDPPIGV